MKENLTDKISKLKDYTGEDRVVTSAEMAHLIENQPKGKTFYSKIPSLDTAIEGFESGELIAISGPRKSGKTLLSQTFTETFQRKNIKSLWFSYELTPRQFLRCFPSLPLFYMPIKLKAHALDWIQDRIVEAIAKYGISVVFLDHLHFLFDIARSRNSSIEIGQVIRFLKTLAIELNIVIFVLCHMNKIQAGKEPSDENFRDSSFIAQESDTGLIIWRTKDSDNHAWLKVCYSRKTGCWEKKIKLMKVDGFLREIMIETDNNPSKHNFNPINPSKFINPDMFDDEALL